MSTELVATCNPFELTIHKAIEIVNHFDKKSTVVNALDYGELVGISSDDRLHYMNGCVLRW